MSEVSLPKAVRDQMEEAERIEAALAAETAPQTAAPEPEAPAPETTPTPEPPTPEPVTPEPTPEPTPPPTPEATWEQRYKTLKGMFDANARTAAQTIRDLETQLAAANTEVDRLKLAPTPAPAELPGLTAKDLEDFGPELVDLVKRVSGAQTQTLQAEVNRLNGELTTAKEQLGGVSTRQGQADQASFVAALTGEVADWEAINVDEDFHLWLAQNDPMSGRQRQKLLEEAAAAFDSARVTTIFKNFKQETGRADPPATPEPRPAPSITPPTGKTPPAPTPPAEKKWSQKEINDFYTDVRKGLYKGRETEANAIEAQIDAAVASNRVTS